MSDRGGRRCAILPASMSAERQIVSTVRGLLDGHRVATVAVVSVDDQAAKKFVEALGEDVNVSTHNDVEQLAGLSDLDILIANKALSKNVNHPEKLDEFVKSALKAVRFGGVVIVREDLKDAQDGKQVARLTDYFDVFRVAVDGKNTGLELYAVEEVEDSLYAHQNWLDFYWSFTKKEFPQTTGENVTFRDFLDKTQYTDTGIYAYEWIFGDNFISPGGYEENLKVIKRFGDLRAGQTMLDIGVGIGGGARQVANEFGVHVKGIDLSSNMLAVALERVQKEKDARVRYSITDALVYKFVPNSFDYVFSRDCIQHIPDTELLFSRIYDSLKPGGKVLITMYGCGYGELSEKFKAYVAQRHYFLKNLKQIEEIAKKTGFTNIYTENLTGRFKEILGEERSRVEDNKEEFLSKFSQKEYDSLVRGWGDKLGYIADDNHNWNLFLAEKPF
ncbi:unnamed protein product [Caenorhabditis auriculariae]|uniref:phosphoethanolamine N-methyltransferase n=1 Tax=Caenorhabditis auriculariae TaxID=2777116 RepID=A0A8S1GVI8_9PELO|nr:unnamed protein product [Caenorhabditis auriculariae]